MRHCNCTSRWCVYTGWHPLWRANDVSIWVWQVYYRILRRVLGCLYRRVPFCILSGSAIHKNVNWRYQCIEQSHPWRLNWINWIDSAQSQDEFRVAVKAWHMGAQKVTTNTFKYADAERNIYLMLLARILHSSAQISTVRVCVGQHHHNLYALRNSTGHRRLWTDHRFWT